MTEENLKDLSIDELLKLLAQKQRHLALSKMDNEDPELIEYNKKALEKVQRAIVEKREDPFGHVNK